MRRERIRWWRRWVQLHLTVLCRSGLDAGATGSALIPDAVFRSRYWWVGRARLVVGHVRHLRIRRKMTSRSCGERFARECTAQARVGCPRAAAVIELERPYARQGLMVSWVPILLRRRQTGRSFTARLSALVVALQPIDRRVNACWLLLLPRCRPPVTCAVQPRVLIARGLVLHHRTRLHVACHLEIAQAAIAFTLPKTTI